MILTDPDLALIELNRLTQDASCPALSAEETLDILERHKRASLWTVSTAFEIGAVVIPTLSNRNGHRYRAIQYTDAGTDQQTGATEPTWSTVRDARITDNHVVWQEDGDDYGAVLWDLMAAARDGWLLKAAKATKRVDFETQSIGVTASQLYDHCIDMANKYQSVFVL